MKPYDRNQVKGVSQGEISQSLINYRHLTPEELFLQGLNPEDMEPSSLQAIIQDVCELFQPRRVLIMQFHRN